jgi:chromosome segregation ATPase
MSERNLLQANTFIEDLEKQNDEMRQEIKRFEAMYDDLQDLVETQEIRIENMKGVMGYYKTECMNLRQQLANIQGLPHPALPQPVKVATLDINAKKES